LPFEQQTGKGLRESGAKRFALAELTKSVTGHGISYYQCRGAPLSGKKNTWLPDQGKNFLLTAPAVKNMAYVGETKGHTRPFPPKQVL